MVLRIIRSKICRPSNFHKPKFCTSHMQKATRSDLPLDEMARRKDYQKIIDYTFGPPILHEHDDIRSDLAQKEDDSATNLMEKLKDKPLHSTHAVFGQEHKSTQKGEELWSRQNVQEAHRINSQNWPRQALQTDFGECRADSSHFYSVQHMGPHYYRQMEAQMYDNFAQKYLRTETDEIDKLDKLLAMEMESLELPKPERKGMRAPINISNNVDTVDTRGYHTDASVASRTVAPDYNHHWCTHCCQYFPPHLNVNDKTTINLFDDNVEEGFTLESNSYGYHDDILPINVIHCSDLPLDCVPKSFSNPPNEKLQLDEYEPCRLLQPAPLVQERCVEWGDKSREIVQPIESSETIVQILAYPESAVDSKPQNVPVNESTDHHMIQEAGQPYNVNYNPQIEPKIFQQQLHPLTKMNLIETNISEHINTHKESYVQAHLETEQTTEPLKPWTEEKLKKIMRHNPVDPSPVENTESEPRRTDTVEQNFMHSTPQGLEQQARFNPFAAENTEPLHQQQTWANQFEVENTESEPRRTDAVEQNFMYSTPQGLEQQARFNPFAAENTEPSPQQQTWANQFGVENTESEPQRTDVEVQNFMHASPHGLEQQARFNPFAVENTEQSTQQQTWTNPFGVENKEPSPQRTDSMVRHCVHAQSIPHSEPNAKIADPVDNILTNLHLHENLSLSELLQRVRALNRLQYCRECGMMVASKCPPTDRPQCPPPPDCARDCPPPEKPKCTPCPECPPEPPCPPPQPKCPSEPKCPPPKPKCPPEPKCPPPAPPTCPPPEKKPKCPSPCPPPTGPGKCGCQSTEPDHPVTVHTLLKGKLSEYFMGLINKGLSKLKHTLSLDSLVFEASHSKDTETLQLNRVKDFEPWVPLPSWPYPVDVKKKKLQCPAEGCPGPKQFPWRPNCPPLPCSGFPKRLKISQAN